MSALTSETTGKIAAALIDAQNDFKPAVRDATNPHFGSQFVSLGGVLGAVSEALRTNGIALVQQADLTDQGMTVLVTRLIHKESGEWLASVYPVRPVKADPQSEGSALTYARRYALMSLVGIAPEDDDGTAGAAPDREAEQAEREREALRAEIWTAAQGQGLTTWTDIASDFASWSMGVSMKNAEFAELERYREHLKSAAVAS